MTLAAAFILEGLPCVVSDLLITFDKGEEQPGLTLPAIGPIAALPQARRLVHGLRQKLFVVSSNLVVAFAGDVRIGKYVLRALRKLAVRGPLTWAELLDFLRTRESFMASIALVGFFAEPQGGGSVHMRRLQHKGETFDGGHLGEVDAAGTGVPLLKRACLDGWIGPSGFETLPDSLRALCKAISLCGAFTREEHASASGVVEAATGGAFEIAYYTGSTFVKAEVTFVVWYVDVRGEIVDVKEPYLFIKSTYVDDVLILNCARWSCDPDGKNQHWSLETHAVPPPYRDEVDHSLPVPKTIGFRSPVTQHAILVMQGSESHLVSVVEPGQSALEPEETAGIFQFSLNQELRDVMLAPARNAIARAAKN